MKPSSLYRPARPALALIFLALAAPSGALAQEATQTLQLQEGWNAVNLQVGAFGENYGNLCGYSRGGGFGLVSGKAEGGFATGSGGGAILNFTGESGSAGTGWTLLSQSPQRMGMEFTPVPEPGSAMLAGLGICLLLHRNNRPKAQSGAKQEMGQSRQPRKQSQPRH